MAHKPTQKIMTTQENPGLRLRLVKLAQSSRKYTIPETVDINKPQSARSDTVTLNGEILTRRRIVIITRGCGVATCTMCPLPGEAVDPAKRAIRSENLIAQFDSAYPANSPEKMVTIYDNGNFFDDREISPQVRIDYYQKIAASPAKILSVESLPQFIDDAKISEIREHLGGKQIMVSIGLQSADDTIREVAINSTCTRTAFEKAVRLLKEVNGIVQPFFDDQTAVCY